MESLTPSIRAGLGSHDAVDALSYLIQRKLGIKTPPAKRSLVENRVQRRMRALKLESIETYRAYLLSAEGGSELLEFINEVTTNKTEFFREANHFDYLSQQVLPRLTKSARNPHRLHVWCAGCSSGEEAYTLAIVLAEWARRCAGFEYRILATDVSLKMLEQARAGIYSADRLAPVPPELQKRYFMRGKDASRELVRVVPALRELISFHRLNFMAPHYAVVDVYDVIFFRNVAIYFEAPTAHAVVQRLCRHLRNGGYFFTGHTESLIGTNTLLERVAPATYRKR